MYVPSSLDFILVGLKILRQVFGQVASIKMYWWKTNSFKVHKPKYFPSLGGGFYCALLLT